MNEESRKRIVVAVSGGFDPLHIAMRGFFKEQGSWAMNLLLSSITTTATKPLQGKIAQFKENLRETKN